MHFFFIFAALWSITMDENKHTLKEPAAEYGRKVKASDVVFQPMANMMETLRSQGYISHEELVNRLSQDL